MLPQIKRSFLKTDSRRSASAIRPEGNVHIINKRCAELDGAARLRFRDY